MQFIFDSVDYIKVITNEVLDEPYLSKEPDGYSFYWHFIRDFSEKYKFSLTSDIKQEIKKKVEYVLNLRETLNEKTDLAEYKQYFNGELNLYPFQAKAVKFIVEQKRVLLADDVGLGKAQPLYCNVLTARGWKKMGDINIGDEIIDPIDGGIQKINGIYPQGKKDIFEVTFSDGSKTRCTESHLWCVQTSNHKQRHLGFSVKNLSELKKTLIHCRNKRLQWYVPITNRINFEHKSQYIPPYLLGCLIGDGSLRENAVGYSCADNEMIEMLKKLLPADVSFKKNNEYNYRISGNYRMTGEMQVSNSLLCKLRQLRLAGKKSEKKFIPDCYKFNSYIVRLKVFQGLMDTDGYISKDNTLQFTSVSEQLVNDVKFIVESFGGTVRLNSKIPTFTYLGIKKNGQRAYTLTISLPKNIEPFLLTRKRVRYKKRKKYLPYRKIKSIECIGKEECKCISVDTQHGLYLTDSCIVTHNSIIALGTILELVEKKGKMKFLVVVPASLRLQWLGECRKFINKEMFPDMEFHVVNKTKGERAYLYKQFKKSDNPSIMLISYDFVRSDKEALQDIPFDMIVLDEAQKLKTRRTKINKTVRKFFPNIEYKLAMTATPIENGFEDLYCISEYLDKERLCSKTYFQDRYCIINRRRLWHRNIDIFEIVGYKNLHDAKEKLAGLYVRRTIGDVEMELPAVIKNNIFLDLTNEQSKMYSEIKGEIFGEMTREDILARMIFLQEVCDSTELLKPEKKFSSKVEELKRLLEEDLKYTKTIIITHYKKFADVLERELESTNPLVITGDTNMTLRQNILSQFNADDSKRVLIGTEAIQEGINLQVANVLVNADMSWNPAKLQQRLGRLRRLTSKHKTIRMINLIVRDTIEEHILDVLYDKGQLFEQMFKKDADVQIKNLLGMKKEELMNLI
jgi:superfamily II DNA or RNA helicase